MSGAKKSFKEIKEWAFVYVLLHQWSKIQNDVRVSNNISYKAALFTIFPDLVMKQVTMHYLISFHVNTFREIYKMMNYWSRVFPNINKSGTVDLSEITENVWSVTFEIKWIWIFLEESIKLYRKARTFYRRRTDPTRQLFSEDFSALCVVFRMMNIFKTRVLPGFVLMAFVSSVSTAVRIEIGKFMNWRTA